MLSRPAKSLLDAYDHVQTVNRDSWPRLDSLEEAIRIQDEIVAARVTRGEVRLGYKIGFTNRTIWERYGVHHPIWAPVYDTTVEQLNEPFAQIRAGDFAEPRLEPEIVVRLASVPEQASPVAIAHSLDWVAHGFEIVQSHFAHWQFSGAESFAAQGLHGALKIGPRIDASELCPSRDDLPAWLSKLTVALWLDDRAEPVDQGVGSNVLDGPLHAIAHLMRELKKGDRSLAAGDIITTGTLTDAQPLLNDQQWQSRLGLAGPLQDLGLEVTSDPRGPEN